MRTTRRQLAAWAEPLSSPVLRPEVPRASVGEQDLIEGIGLGENPAGHFEAVIRTAVREVEISHSHQDRAQARPQGGRALKLCSCRLRLSVSGKRL